MNACDNCGKLYGHMRELPRVFPDIPNLLQRLSPGGTVPAGECPECGALVYPKAKPVRVLVLLEGGLVQDVVADGPGIEAAVLNQDVEGMFDEDLVDVVGEVGSLRGTLQTHDVTEAPMLVESAWRSS